MHCLFTRNGTNGCDHIVTGVNGSLPRILAWTKFHHPTPKAIMAPGIYEDPVIFKPLCQIDLVCPHIKSLVTLTLPHTFKPLESLKFI